MTNIEWTDATWNPVTGCSKVSAGCKNCYAEVVAESRADRIAADTSPYGPYDDEMLPAFAGCGEGMGAAVWACGLVVVAIVALAVIGAVVGGGR